MDAGWALTNANFHNLFTTRDVLMRIADCGFRNNSSAIRNPKSEITCIELRTPNSELRTVRGLTLVELLVAMAILVIVSGSTLLIFRGITRAWRTGELRSERYQQARLLFELFEREIASSVANVRYPMVGINSSDKADPGRFCFVFLSHS